jgi:hypothetical protein
MRGELLSVSGVLKSGVVGNRQILMQRREASINDAIISEADRILR